MKKHFVTTIVFGAVLLVGTMVRAEKWDKNEYKDRTVESSYYDANSIKVENKRVSWTEKYVFNDDGAVFNSKQLSKYEVCKQGITKKGNVTQFQVDYEIDNGKKFRALAKRYYNKNNEMLCSDKDMGKDFQSVWMKMIPRSPIQDSYYDLVTKYKINLQK